MIRLPALTPECPHWQLPLSDAGVGALLGALLADGRGEGVARLRELLADEPPLLLWSVCRSPCWRSEPPNGLDDVAVWLSLHGLSVLRWEQGQVGDAPACPGPPLETWAGLAEASAAVSQLAVRLSREPAGAPDTRNIGATAETGPGRAKGDSVCELHDAGCFQAGVACGGGIEARSCLLGLLHNARAWLAASTPATAAPPPPTCLPNWLVQWLDDLASPSPRDAIAAIVARAVQIVNQSAPEDAGSPVGRAADEGAAAAESGPCVRERWLGTQPGVGDFLPGAILKLARLRQLEQQFDQTLETEKLEALQAFAYGASHEINNPLANISTRAQTLLREEPDPERRRKLAVMNSQAFRAHELIADLMLFARPPSLRVEPVDLVALVDQVLRELATDAQSQQTTLVRLPNATPAMISADAGHLAAALRSLCVNALEALRLGGRIEVSVQAITTPVLDSDGGDWVEIAVADTGPGIPPEVRRHLFDPYFSGREAGRGLGLGLSKCWTIVSQHGGRMEVDSGPQAGATFRMRLPSRGAASAASGVF